MVAFGWSPGDIVQSVRIIIKLCEALREADGAEAKYSETTTLLESFARTLTSLRDFTNGNPQAKYSSGIVEQIKLNDRPYAQFEAYLIEYYPSSGAGSTQQSIRKAPKKAQWALKELSEASGKVIELKKAISDPLLCIEPLLLLQSLQSIEDVFAHVSEMPNTSQFESLMKVVSSDTTRALTGVEQQIRDFAQATTEHKRLLEAQAESLIKLAQCLSRKGVAIRSAISQENEKNQQHRVSENAKLIINLEARVSELEQHLATILGKIEDTEILQGDQMIKMLHEQKLAFDQMHQSMECSVSKLVDMIALMEAAIQYAAVPQQLENTSAWLGEIARQLLVSGLTSGMAGILVALAMRDPRNSKAPDDWSPKQEPPDRPQIYVSSSEQTPKQHLPKLRQKTSRKGRLPSCQNNSATGGYLKQEYLGSQQKRVPALPPTVCATAPPPLQRNIPRVSIPERECNDMIAMMKASAKCAIVYSENADTGSKGRPHKEEQNGPNSPSQPSNNNPSPFRLEPQHMSDLAFASRENLNRMAMTQHARGRGSSVEGIANSSSSASTGYSQNGWLCCQCTAYNLLATTPDRCPVCSHARCLSCSSFHFADPYEPANNTSTAHTSASNMYAAAAPTHGFPYNDLRPTNTYLASTTALTCRC